MSPDVIYLGTAVISVSCTVVWVALAMITKRRLDIATKRIDLLERASEIHSEGDRITGQTFEAISKWMARLADAREAGARAARPDNVLEFKNPREGA